MKQPLFLQYTFSMFVPIATDDEYNDKLPVMLHDHFCKVRAADNDDLEHVLRLALHYCRMTRILHDLNRVVQFRAVKWPYEWTDKTSYELPDFRSTLRKYERRDTNKQWNPIVFEYDYNMDSWTEEETF